MIGIVVISLVSILLLIGLVTTFAMFSILFSILVLLHRGLLILFCKFFRNLLHLLNLIGLVHPSLDVIPLREVDGRKMKMLFSKSSEKMSKVKAK